MYWVRVLKGPGRWCRRIVKTRLFGRDDSAETRVALLREIRWGAGAREVERILVLFFSVFWRSGVEMLGLIKADCRVSVFYRMRLEQNKRNPVCEMRESLLCDSGGFVS
jgi:hypothetical protein